MANPNDYASHDTVRDFDHGAAISFADVVDLIPAMLIVYQGGLAVYASPGSVSVTGYRPAEVLELTTAKFVHPASIARVNEIVNSPPDELPHEKEVVRFLGKSGDVKWVELATKSIQYQGGPATLFVCTDVTETRQAAATVDENEVRFKTLFDRAIIGLAIGDISPEGRILEANRAYEKMLGYRRGELKGRSFTEITHRDDIDKDMDRYRELINGKLDHFQIEKRYIHKDGSAVYGRFTGILVRDPVTNQPIHSFGIVQDMTDERNANRQLLGEKRLLRQLLELQDKERRIFSCDIHDGLVQDITGAMLRIQSLPYDFETNGLEVPAVLAEAEALLAGAADEGRRLMNELRPMMIEDLGLKSAINSVIAKEYPGFPISIESDMRVDELELSEDLEGQIYRILQEALNNVRRHSQATEASVRITQPGKFLVIEVMDNGVGFDLDAVPNSRSGVSGILERARLFGGAATYETAPGKGTHLTVSVPIDAALLDALDGYGTSSTDLRITN